MTDFEKFEPTPEQMIEQAGLAPAVEIETVSKVIDLMAALKESLSPGAPEKAAEVIEAAMLDAGAVVIVSGPDTKGWRATRKDGIETFTAADGTAYVRASNTEDADVIVTFTRIPGMSPMRLVRADESSTVRRAEKKKRREERELRKRGYDV